jgi:hypothetical protein
MGHMTKLDYEKGLYNYSPNLLLLLYHTAIVTALPKRVLLQPPLRDTTCFLPPLLQLISRARSHLLTLNES